MSKEIDQLVWSWLIFDPKNGHKRGLGYASNIQDVINGLVPRWGLASYDPSLEPGIIDLRETSRWASEGYPSGDIPHQITDKVVSYPHDRKTVIAFKEALLLSISELIKRAQEKGGHEEAARWIDLADKIYYFNP
jgi:hypothetical protein